MTSNRNGDRPESERQSLSRKLWGRRTLWSPAAWRPHGVDNGRASEGGGGGGLTDRQKTDGLRSSNEKLAKCVQTLHAKGLGRLARAITNKSGSLGRGVKGLSIYGRFKGEHEEPDSD